MAKNQPTIADAFHVIFGDSAGGSGKLAGFKRCLSLVDPLCPGPCDQDPVGHLRKRKAYIVAEWEAYDGPNADIMRDVTKHWAERLIGAKAFARLVARQSKDRPVVLWTTPTLPDRLPFWWMLDALQNTATDQRRCWVADIRTRFPDCSPAPLGTIAPKELFALFDNALQPLSAVRRESVLWRKFASPSPLGFDRARRTMLGLEPICEPYGMFFAQVESTTSLRLSQLDQELFDTLASRKWLRPLDLLRRSRRLIEEFLIFGDVMVVDRLRAWAKHGPNAAIEKRREARPTNDWTAMSFRLTPNGERIRDKGLQSLNEAPPMFVGGCQLYMVSDPWVRRNRGRSWRIERLRP